MSSYTIGEFNTSGEYGRRVRLSLVWEKYLPGTHYSGFQIREVLLDGPREGRAVILATYGSQDRERAVNRLVSIFRTRERIQAERDRRDSAKLVRTPIAMNAFFDLPEVKRCQAVQGQFPSGSAEKESASAELRRIADLYCDDKGNSCRSYFD